MEIYCLSEDTPEVDDNTFGGMDVSNVLLVVLDDAVQKYKAHPIWGQFSIKTTTDVQLLGAEVKSARVVYDFNGRQQPTLHKGLNIVRMSDGTVKKVLVK